MKITQQRAEELKKKIEFYRSRKENNIFDSFYHTDLDIFVALIDANTLTPEEEQAAKDEAKRLRLEEEERRREENDRMVCEALTSRKSNPSDDTTTSAPNSLPFGPPPTVF